MSVDRPTFSEMWHQVADLRAKLRGFVQVHRQFYRGRLCYVLRDPSNNRFYQFNDAAYHLVGLLNGRRTVAEAWELCNQHLGDRAPTQGETIQLLSQLYGSNLLGADLPPDAAGLFKRQQKRVQREARQYLMNLLFARVPLFDPDRLLDALNVSLRWIFGPVGVAVWAIVILLGLGALASDMPRFWNESAQLVRQVNVSPMDAVWLYLCFVGVKALHELGHGLACKRFGESEHVAGEVHQLGVMLLVLMPVPYVDASSSWAFRSKWRRAMVAAAGMYVELAVAAVAAVVWLYTNDSSLTHGIAYNVVLIASVSTLLFNGNPLLRFDGYYIVSDLLEIPNLMLRSKQFLHFVVKRYVYGVQAPRDPSHSRGERPWLVVYAVAASAYRVVILAGIVFFVADKLFFLGALLAVSGVIGWLGVPLARFLHYLIASPELTRARPRAVFSSLLILGAVAIPLGMIPVPDHGRSLGVVEPARFARLHTGAEGFLEHAAVSVQRATAAGAPVALMENTELRIERRRLAAEQRLLETRHAMALAEAKLAEAQMIRLELRPVLERAAEVELQLARLAVQAPWDGTWLPMGIGEQRGALLSRGATVGWFAGDGEPVVRLVADQYLGPHLLAELQPGDAVEVRPVGRPDPTWKGRVLSIVPAGQRELPAASLGIPAGGTIPVRPADPAGDAGPQAAEPFFEIHVQLPEDAIALGPADRRRDPAPLHPLQRVEARLDLPPAPLLTQGWRWMRQLVQRRLQI